MTFLHIEKSSGYKNHRTDLWYKYFLCRISIRAASGPILSKFKLVRDLCKVSKGAKIRNRHNQVSFINYQLYIYGLIIPVTCPILGFMFKVTPHMRSDRVV